MEKNIGIYKPEEKVRKYNFDFFFPGMRVALTDFEAQLESDEREAMIFFGE